MADGSGRSAQEFNLKQQPPGSPQRSVLITCLCAVILLQSGCAGHFKGWLKNGFKVGPDYGRPPAQVADQWIDADNPHVISDESDYRHWWAVFNDPVLDHLIQTAYSQNLPLRVAALRVLEARAQLGIARGGLFPQQQQVFGDYQRTQISQNIVPENQLPPGIASPRAFDFWGTGFDAAWELDVWGRFRRAIESADANLDVTVEDYDDVLVTLIADVAANYVDLRTQQQRLQYARQNVKIQQGSLWIATKQREAGTVSDLDVQQAKSNLADTKASIPFLETQVRRAQNRLCTLLGMPTHDLEYLLGKPSFTDDALRTEVIPQAPADIALGVPADLLRRRPDVRAAERQVAAQSAQIGVAASDLFPSFSLVGSIGVQAENFSDLFRQSSTAGAIGAPSVSWNVLNYGRIRNNIRVQDARFQQLAVNYENVVLEAGQEVEDGLIGFLNSHRETNHLAQSAAAAKRAVELATTQYREGIVDYNRVFSLQTFLVEQQDAYALADGEIAFNLIRVYKALGGGWDMRLTQPGCVHVAEPLSPKEGPPPEEGPPPGPQPLDKDLDLARLPIVTKAEP